MQFTTLTTTAKNGFEWLAANYAWILILLTLLLFSTKTLFNIPMGIMAVLGIYQVIITPRKILRDAGVRFLLLAFLCLWLPMLISLADAVDLPVSSETVFPYLHYLFASIFIAVSLRPDRVRHIIHTGIFIIVTFWCVDALIQFFAGKDLFGYPYVPPQLTGMFYPKMRLGYIAAVASPFMFEYIRQNFNDRPWLVLMIVPLCAVILLSGKRVAWLMLAVAVVLYFVYLWITARKISPNIMISSLFLGLVIVTLLYTCHPPFQHRVDQSLGIFSYDYEQADVATARRLDLWKTSIAIFRGNWVNGTGPRSFRNVYSGYADADDFWMENGRSGQTHPHQFVMEIAAETGIIGIIGYFLFWLSLLVAMWREHKAENTFFITWSLCVIVALFPLNAHLAFYGSYWSSLVWLLLPITAAWHTLPQDIHGNK
ncbi:MAG: hypothetical protein A2W28_08430 [Gammaproteobacteria bacterium RBG_16_51_14]|nr:MAG: hypothetical protein A2W28_08430 [Gammaproteobacteria bacterium RBG_16_51_14]